MVNRQHGLGRGSGRPAFLLPCTGRPRTPARRPRSSCRSTRSLPNPKQPRKDFDDKALQDLAASLTQSGVLQPVVVRRIGDGYQLVVGERRWRAAKLAGLDPDPGGHSRSDRRGEPRAGARGEPAARGPEPDGGSGGLSAPARRVRLDPGRAGPARPAATGAASPTACACSSSPSSSRRTSARTGSRWGTRARSSRSPPLPSSSGCARRSWRIPGRCAPPRKACRPSARSPPRRQLRRSPELAAVEDSLRVALATRVRLVGSERAGRIEIAYSSREELDRLAELITTRPR